MSLSLGETDGGDRTFEINNNPNGSAVEDTEIYVKDIRHELCWVFNHLGGFSSKSDSFLIPESLREHELKGGQ